MLSVSAMLLVSLVLVGLAVQAGAQESVNIGSRKQLFIDHSLIAAAHDVALTMNPPRKTGESCIVSDRPWEGHRVGGYTSVAEDDGIYKMWYDAIASDGSRWLCYATSEDGVHWEKPSLGLVEFGGTKETNILFPPQKTPFEPGCVFKDTNPDCPPEQRYKAVVTYHPTKDQTGTWALVSPDGLRFSPLGDGPCFRASDTGNIAFWDEAIGRYVGYVRMWQPMRKVGRCEFDDFARWGQERTVFGYDALDGDRVDYYTNAALKYPYAANAYFIFPSLYFHLPEPPEGKFRNDGPLDIRMAVSRDGNTWTQPSRKPFVPRAVEGTFDDSALYMLHGLLRQGPELWMYYIGKDFTHGAYDVAKDRRKGVISRLVLRLDGFVSADSSYTGGTLATAPVVFEGSRLELNYEAGVGGHVQVELRGADGAAIGGFSLGEADPLRGNSVQATVTWKGSSDVSALAGKPVTLHFVMRDAKLYAFQFTQ